MIKPAGRFTLFVTFVVLCAMSLFAQGPRTEDSYKSPYNAQNTPVDEDNPENADARREAFNERYGGPLDATIAEHLTNQIEKQRQLSPGSGAQWVSLGPTNANKFQNGVNETATDSGRLRGILQDPGDPNTVYVVVGVGGIWKTKNFFAQKPDWRPLTDDIGTASGAAAFGRTGNTIYYGTGDPLDWGVGGAMYVSNDAGEGGFVNRQQLAGVTDVLSLAVDTSAAQDIVIVGTTLGVFRSVNGGGSYTKVASVPSTLVWSIVRSNNAWLASVQFVGQTRIYRSTDAGASWTDLGMLATDTGRATLAAGGPNGSIVYAIAGRSGAAAGQQRDLFRSADGGLTWTALAINAKVPSNPTFYNRNMAILNNQAQYNQMLIVDPTDSTGNTVFLGGTLTSAVSHDGGASWELLSSWLGSIHFKFLDAAGNVVNPRPMQEPYVHADHHTALIGKDPKGGKVLFWGSDGGIFYSVNDGKNFLSNANEGLTTHMIYTLASTPARPDAVLIGLQDNGTRYRWTNTTTYNGSIGGDGIGTAWTQANNNFAVGTVQFGSIRRWNQPPPNNQAKYEVIPIPTTDGPFFTNVVTPTAAADPNGVLMFSASPTRYFRWNEGAHAWDLVQNFTPTPFRVRLTVHPIGLSPNNLQHQALAGSGGLVGVTHDGGVNWTFTQLIGMVPGWDGFTSNVAIAANNSTMYATSESPNFPRTRVAKSTNGGTLWTNPANPGCSTPTPPITCLPDVPVQKIVIDPRSANGDHAFAGTWIGVYETTDGGINWTRFGTGLPTAIVTDIYIFPDGSKIRIGTYGRGVWERGL